MKEEYLGYISNVIANLSLLQFPLVSRSGRIRMLMLEANDTKVTKVSRIYLTGLPGGSDAFKLAAKFCYGVNVDITISNVALLRCEASFMKMTEDISEKKLEIRTEVFLKDAVFPNISNSIFVLHHCETLLSVSEEVNIVSQLTNAIANNACKEQLTFGLLKLEYNFPPKPIQCVDSETPSDWSDLERRIGLQLDQTILEDILIPANLHGNNHNPV
ncbi:BTB/POZ domain-containing protein SETH6 [Capsicum baccatum]|uniref:BTB/POZ domain-containing protein SETH6 n=1 Tax=Capsicum baccatum TaxID=33114 RepID=A0A2G2WRZ1_CAPBA|nr:BTB/POZ domain-containing protein SETH6 [Capsicum baccatum]